MRRKLIIHIGAHKTGSTSIQKFFAIYSNYFETHYNLVYPIENQIGPKFGYWGHHYLSWYYTPPTDNLELGIFNNMNLAHDSFIKLISSSKSNILLSSEDFIWNIKIRGFIDDVKDKFDKITVIMYVRRQVDVALSLYQTAVVNEGYTGSFQDWFKKANYMFDYFSILKKWEELGCKLIVKPYIREKIENGDIILDFLKTLGEILDREISPPEDYEPQSIKVNVSLPDFITMMIRYYNSQPSKVKVVPILRELGLKLIEIMPDLPKYDFVPPSVKKEIINTYKGSNKLLCEKYLGSEYLEWLNKDIEEDDKIYFERFGYPGAQLVELCKAVIKILETYYKT
ncbi:MAG: hypothetical protein QXW71_05610 [Thermoplasmata archaeon]